MGTRLGLLLAASSLILASCGGPPTMPSARISGRIVSNGDGAAIAGAILTVSGRTISADASGQFSLDESSSPVAVTVSAPGYVTRQTHLAGSASGVIVDLIADRSPFSLDLYRDLARGAWQCVEQTGSTCARSLRRWEGAPNVFIKSSDESGAEIPSDAIVAIRNDVTRLVPLFSGGRYQVGSIEVGPALVDRTGWITIELISTSGSTRSVGDAGAAGGVHIQLYGFRPVPVTDAFGGGCPRYGGVNHHIIAHEFGHAMGFRHTRNQPGVMNTLGALSAGACNAEPSTAELFHAAIVYSRPPGNADVDVDPPGFTIGISR